MRISDWSSDVCSSDLRSLARRCFRRQSKGSDRNIESRAPASPAPVFMHGTGFREFSDGTAIRASGPVLHLVNDFHGAELGSAGDGTARKHRLDDFGKRRRSEEHTSELQSLMRISYVLFCLTKKIYSYK